MAFRNQSINKYRRIQLSIQLNQNLYKKYISSQFRRLFPKLKIGKQINALADYAKPISSELALFDWPLLRQINVC